MLAHARRGGCLALLAAARQQAGSAWMTAARSKHRLTQPSAEEEAKRADVRKQRRKQKRELRKQQGRMGEFFCQGSTFVWQGTAGKAAKGANGSDGDAFDFLRALLGGPWSSGGAGSHRRSSGRRSGRSSSRGSQHGRAGASAGPQWGHASSTWSDFGDPSRSRGSTTGWGDEEAWYEPPKGRRAKPRVSFGDGTFEFHFDWDSAWQQQQQQQGSERRAGAGAAAHLRQLGLETAWLDSRCGKRLRAAYLARAKAEHPDMHCRSAARPAAEERFKKVQAAYTELLTLVAA